MTQYSSLEEYAAHVGKVTSKALGAMFNRMGSDHPQAIAIETLCTEAANIVQTKKMREEQAGGYDLAALRVDHTVPSNSETGFERED